MSALFSTILIFFPNHFPFIDPRNRAGLAKISFDDAGAFALIPAALEFRKGQRNPSHFIINRDFIAFLLHL